MTSQRELDRVLGGFFVEGTNEVADRVIEAALDQIDHIPQRHATRLPRRFQRMSMSSRLAAAAVIGVIAIGGALYLIRPGPSGSGTASPTPGATATQVHPTPTAPVPTPTAKPSPMALTGPLGAGRQTHVAALLVDGRVLIAGGFDVNDQPLATAVIYDPGTGSFSPTGSMRTARALFTATTLSDGRVLVAGGGPATWGHPGPLLASAELYDPKTGTFSPTASMATPREGHSATLLPDGRVLIAGGIVDSAGSHAVASAELYDPKTGTFSPGAAMTAARSFHTATMLADGRVLIAGGDPAGWTATEQIVASAEIYDQGTGKFTTTGSMAAPRGDHAATLLADGRVLLTGGENGNGTLGSTELYDPKTGTFSSAASMTIGRIWQTASLLMDGRVLIAGGGGDYANREFLDSAELFDPATGEFTKTGSMSEQRTYHTSTLLSDGRVLIAGGYGNLAPLANGELYDPTTGTFSPAG